MNTATAHASQSPRRRSRARPPGLPLDSPDDAGAPDWELEWAARTAGWARIAGVDEAGRGPLAGPVVAAAVVLPSEFALAGLDDSKRLTSEQREWMFALIVEAAEGWAVASASPEEIDTLNILRATHLAMARALAELQPPPDGALVDGLPVQGLPCPHRAVVRGDSRSVSIAAASVLAKVTRDRHMVELDAEFPGYGFARHKGYPTASHIHALRELGLSRCHRRSFGPVARLDVPR